MPTLVSRFSASKITFNNFNNPNNIYIGRTVRGARGDTRFTGSKPSAGMGGISSLVVASCR